MSTVYQCLAAILTLIILLLVIFLPISAVAKVEIHNHYVDGDSLKVVVLYTNDSNKKYDRVQINCSALNSNKEIIDFDEETLYEHNYGMIEPGFSTPVKLSIKLHGKTASGIECGAHGAFSSLE